MLSKRLEAIIQLIDKDNSIIDIGTDHAYLPIEIFKRRISSKVIGTDISLISCQNAQKNIIKNGLTNKIQIINSDGFKNITEKYDIGIIAGLGTKTILKILDDKHLPKKLIIASQNDYYFLRKELNKKFYHLIKEVVIFDKKYYPIMKFCKKDYLEKLSEKELLFGKSNNLNYYKYLIKKYHNLYSKTNKPLFLRYINILSRIIEKN